MKEWCVRDAVSETRLTVGTGMKRAIKTVWRVTLLSALYRSALTGETGEYF